MIKWSLCVSHIQTYRWSFNNNSSIDFIVYVDIFNNDNFLSIKWNDHKNNITLETFTIQFQIQKFEISIFCKAWY